MTPNPAIVASEALRLAGVAAEVRRACCAGDGSGSVKVSFTGQSLQDYPRNEPLQQAGTLPKRLPGRLRIGVTGAPGLLNESVSADYRNEEGCGPTALAKTLSRCPRRPDAARLWSAASPLPLWIKSVGMTNRFRALAAASGLQRVLRLIRLLHNEPA